ncbi:MAG: hypothetical protein IKJ69_01535 [Clostridia bacterium]|nr:hypothetical protein [Clostridia bacterium]
MDDHDLHFKYIVGHRINADQYNPSTFVPNADNVATIRLLNMQYTNDNFIILSDERQIDEKAIEEKLNCSSVSFLSEGASDITVMLNQKGENMFRTIVHNRPQYISRSEDYENGWRYYKLKGTPFQASVYFCSFEDNAKIVDPPGVIEAIKTRLKKAHEIYFSDKTPL